MKKFSFYLPSPLYGGTEILMIRLIEYLSTYHLIKIYTEKKSYIDLNYKSKNPNIKIKYDITNADGEYFIISSKYLIELSKKIKKSKVNLFIWQLQPIELISQFFPARRFNRNKSFYNKMIDVFYKSRKKAVKELLTNYNNNDELFFMDIENYNTNNNYLNLAFEKINILPVSIPFNKNDNIEKKKNNNLTFCVVSRISYDFKYYSILNFIKSLELYIKENNIVVTLNIVGDGEALGELKEYAATSKIHFIFHGIVPIEEVYTRIFPTIDISFGMGTSLIDSSKYKIPTIVTNISNKNDSEKNIKYSMFYESEGFSLASYNNIGKKSLNVILDDVIANLTEHGEKCYLYAMNNHSSEIIFEKINKLISINKKPYSVDNVYNTMKHAKYLDYIYNILFSLVKRNIE